MTINIIIIFIWITLKQEYIKYSLIIKVYNIKYEEIVDNLLYY